MVSSDQAGSGYYTFDAQNRLVPEVLDLYGLLEQRAAVAYGKYDTHEEIPEGTIIDELIIYTLEDRPVVKERVTELLERRFVEKEFVKEVKLVTVNELPKYNEILNTSVSNLTAEVLTTNPWLGERDLLPTTNMPLPAHQPIRKHSDVNSGSAKPTPTQTPAFEPVAAQSRSDSAIDPAAQNVSHSTSRSRPATPESLMTTTDSSMTEDFGRRSRRRSDSTDKASAACGNPFRAFIKINRQSGDSRKSTPPISPRSPSPRAPRNPFKSFIRSDRKQAEGEVGQAVVPVNGNTEVANPGKPSRFPKPASLSWRFSRPFSGPNSSPPQAPSNNVAAPANLESAQQSAPAKPNLEPFLDQSLNNSGKHLRNQKNQQVGGSFLPESPAANNNASSLPAPPSDASKSAGHSNMQVHEVKASPQRPDIKTKQTQSGPQSPSIRRKEEVLDSVQELPKDSGRSPKSSRTPTKASSNPTSPKTPGSITRTTVEQASNNAAVARCTENSSVDITIADRVTPGAPVSEYFTQLEEYQTVHEVVEQFAEHNYFILEHVIRTIYRGERKAQPYAEMLSRQRLLITDAQNTAE